MNAVSRTKRSSWQITKAVIFALMLREFQTRFGKRRMGAFWVLLEPMLHIAFMMFMFTVIRLRTIPGMDFPVWLLTGIVPFFLMRDISLRFMDTVTANRALFAYPNIKIFDTFVARLFVELIISATIYIILVFILGFWFGYDVSVAYPLRWIASLAIGILFAFSLGMFFCVIVQVMPNSATFIRLLFMPLYFISGVIFPIWSLPQQFLPWLLWNPFLHIIDNIRTSVFLMHPETPGISYSYPISVTIIMLFLALGLYRVRKDYLLSR